MKKLFSKIFRRKQEPENSYAVFWVWFEQYQKAFYNVIKEEGNFEEDFFNHLAPELNRVKKGIWYLCGMYDSNTAELIFTADGDVKTIAFVEELVAAAPHIQGWHFTALKPEYGIEDCNINMNGLSFNDKTLFFYPNELPQYPDEIEINIVHKEYLEENSNDIANGAYIFLDHFLGEIQSAMIIDNLFFVSPDLAEKELIPIEKLKSYLIWREKEFVEKYENVMPDEEEVFSTYEGKMKNGSPYFGIMNSNLLNWEYKVSNPWFVVVKLEFDSEDGMPDNLFAKELNVFEENLIEMLMPQNGNLYIGRETNNGIREIYFACRDFRNISKVLYDVEKNYSLTKKLSYQIYKDKYWLTLKHYMV